MRSAGKGYYGGGELKLEVHGFKKVASIMSITLGQTARKLRELCSEVQR